MNMELQNALQFIQDLQDVWISCIGSYYVNTTKYGLNPLIMRL